MSKLAKWHMWEAGRQLTGNHAGLSQIMVIGIKFKCQLTLSFLMSAHMENIFTGLQCKECKNTMIHKI